MKNNRILSIIILLVLTILTTTSCVSKKKIIYLQDVDSNLSANTSSDFENYIVKDDILRIFVTSADMESVQSFNQVISQATNNGVNVAGQGALQTYLVDSEGNINFPLLGVVNTSGLTRIEFQKKLQTQIFKYVTDAQVDVRIMNYKVTIIGEVNRPGTYKINDNRITLLQAIGLAGDLTIYGKRENIIVLRDYDGIQKSTRVDITNANFIYSPYYYLKQNDTVIVEPNGPQIQSSGYNRYAGTVISIASFLISIAILLTRN
ncbi:MAG: polysaccharide biosynthesis/export family protein [Nonlabens sp.]|uniref:polysaccharide biosynthesis/export family protein n=1 Tax=Nonlabens sp. TaxID=1888209 RepID=UPI003EF8780F